MTKKGKFTEKLPLLGKSSESTSWLCDELTQPTIRKDNCDIVIDISGGAIPIDEEGTLGN